METNTSNIDNVIFEDYQNTTGIDNQALMLVNILQMYGAPVLLLLGTIGNTLVVPVMYTLSQKVLSLCLYLSVLAATDLALLYTRCGNEWLNILTNLDLSHAAMVSSNSLCKLYPFIVNVLLHLSKWSMVCVGIEGVIGTWRPQKLSVLCTISRARMNLLVLIVLLTCLNIHYFWSFELVLVDSLPYVPKSWFCTFTKHGHYVSEVFHKLVWPVLDVLVAEVLPSVILLLSAILMSAQIARGQHRGDQQHQQWRARYQLHPEATDQLHVVITILCYLALLLNLPKFLLTMFYYFGNMDAMSVETQMQMEVVCTMLTYVFQSCKFLVYLVMVKMFREECKQVMCALCPSRPRGKHDRKIYDSRVNAPKRMVHTAKMEVYTI